jgi:hypothetical protein
MMEAIDWSFKESSSMFTALSVSLPVLRSAGLKIRRLVQSWSYVVRVVEFPDDLGIGTR